MEFHGNTLIRLSLHTEQPHALYSAFVAIR